MHGESTTPANKEHITDLWYALPLNFKPLCDQKFNGLANELVFMSSSPLIMKELELVQQAVCIHVLVVSKIHALLSVNDTIAHIPSC